MYILFNIIYCYVYFDLLYEIYSNYLKMYMQNKMFYLLIQY